MREPESHYGAFGGIVICILLPSSGLGAAERPVGCFSAPICVSVNRTKSTLDFNYESRTHQPFTVAVTSSQHGLGGLNHSIHFTTSALPRTQKLFSYQIPARGHWDYEWSIAIHPGEETAQHDPTTVYALPFESGRWVYIVQTYDDPRSHLGSQRFAIDFGVPIGTEVRAARDGVVIGTDDTSDQSSRDGAKLPRSNYVWVRHRDGTIGYYIHLRHRGVAVAMGQAVKTGQLLGYSGCTGYCNGPHLHFHVSTPLQARDDRKFEAYKTFPTVFKTANGVEFLEPNRSYLVP
jgi:murein DD-endopeptidase MepM/ murein hydrolase activator NlpD